VRRRNLAGLALGGVLLLCLGVVIAAIVMTGRSPGDDLTVAGGVFGDGDGESVGEDDPDATAEAGEGDDAEAGAKGSVDPDADWTRKGGTSHYGYKAHLAVDQGHGLIRRVVLTPAKTYESEVADALVCGDERAVYADKAYEHKERRARLKAAGIKDRIMHRSHKHQARLPFWQRRRNVLIAPVRAAVERVFGTFKRCYGYTRVRYFSLAANATQLRLLAIAYNLRRAAALTG
jgi:IS5 family transposase